MAEIEKIRSHMTPVLHDCLSMFLVENADPEEWEYSIPKDQIDAALIHAHYFSQKDIEACLGFDISILSDEPKYQEIGELFDTFVETYQQED